MGEFFQWLSSGSTSVIIFLVVVSILVLSISLIYIVAFSQGREVSFWPPKVGQKPEAKNLPGKPSRSGSTPLPSVFNPVTTMGGDYAEPYTTTSFLQDPSSKKVNVAKIVTNNDLNMGIKLGGLYKESELEIVAGDWRRYRDAGWVLSGWLFSPESGQEVEQGGLSHAVSFFKIHLFDKGYGYIHVLSAANPAHSIWIETDTKFKQEGQFAWDASDDARRTALWEFTWK